ncbi:hypothetical protein Celaphus_00009494 [Cervus elaphus hippelaphus]|uniref:Uncharacterized protein n=1 Tax=Cervus elaphus hippelaphus TaxID=46360 RepID=A0A212C140_CEREH|nr:hypothetical protein Celaphus_00009494 [Cervus elaphus hippelaphus]
MMGAKCLQHHVIQLPKHGTSTEDSVSTDASASMCGSFLKTHRISRTGLPWEALRGELLFITSTPQFLPKITSLLSIINLMEPTLQLLRTSMRLMELRSILSMAPLLLWDLMVDSAFGTKMPEQTRILEQ